MLRANAMANIEKENAWRTLSLPGQFKNSIVLWLFDGIKNRIVIINFIIQKRSCIL